MSVHTRSVHHANHGLSAHMLGLTLTQSTTRTKYTTNIKAKFSYCDQINFNERVLHQEHQNSSILLTTNFLRLQTENFENYTEFQL